METSCQTGNTSNGRTLCQPCHKLTPNYGGRARVLVKGY